MVGDIKDMTIWEVEYGRLLGKGGANSQFLCYNDKKHPTDQLLVTQLQCVRKQHKRLK